MKNDTLIYSWMNEKLELRDTDQYGQGIFAIQSIAQNERLAIFGGHIISVEEEEQLPEGHSDTGVQIAEDLVLSSGADKEPTDCFNHSCDPNAGFHE